MKGTRSFASEASSRPFKRNTDIFFQKYLESNRVKRKINRKPKSEKRLGWIFYWEKIEYFEKYFKNIEESFRRYRNTSQKKEKIELRRKRFFRSHSKFKSIPQKMYEFFEQF